MCPHLDPLPDLYDIYRNAKTSTVGILDGNDCYRHGHAAACVYK